MVRLLCILGLLWASLASASVPREVLGRLTAWSLDKANKAFRLSEQFSSETRFVYDGWLPVQERDANNTARVTYTRGPDLSGTDQGAGGIGGLLARTDANGSAYYHADGAGNITGLMNQNGDLAARYLYGPFGRLTAKWGPLADANAMQFSSMPRHANSGLSLYPFRAYDPNLQRWLTRDPMGEAGGVNLYGFVGNRALNYVDPYGLNWLGEYMQEVGQSFYDLMMGSNPGRYNPYSKGALEGAMGMGIDRDNNVLRDVMGEAASLFGAGAQEAAEQYAAGVLGGVAGQAAGRLACKAGKALSPALKNGLNAAKNAPTPTRFINGVKVTDRATGNVLEGTVDLKPTLDRISSGQPFPHRNDGGIFQNRPLPGRTTPEPPAQAPGYYREYVHPTPGVNGPGPQRVVVGQGGEMYYTPDHYQTFIPINPR